MKFLTQKTKQKWCNYRPFNLYPENWFEGYPVKSIQMKFLSKGQNKNPPLTKLPKFLHLILELKQVKFRYCEKATKFEKLSHFFPKSIHAQNFHNNHLKPPPLKDISLGLNGTKRKGCVHFCNKAQLTFRSSSVSHWCVHTGAFKNCWQGADIHKM